jgi:hypothetical protein
MKSGKTGRVEVAVSQGLLDRRVSGHAPMRIPTKPATHSNRKPATRRSLPRIEGMMFQRPDLVKFGADFGLYGRRFRAPDRELPVGRRWVMRAKRALHSAVA